MGRVVRAAVAVVVAALVVPTVVGGGVPGAAADDPPPPPEPREFSLAVSGDIIGLPVIYNRARRLAGGTGYDFDPFLADIAPLVSAADLAICHLEVPIAPPGTKPTGYPRWSSPPELTGSIARAGFDRCSTASNHTLDKGLAGIDATLDALDAAGLGHSGSARTPAEAVPGIFEVNGVKVAHLAYTFSFNGGRLPKDQPWRANLIDQAKILAAAADVRARGAEVVILSLHWGLEGTSKPLKSQRVLADALTKSGLVDVIVGHHAHRMQPIEQVNGVWVLWNLGNLLSDHRTESRWPAASEDGAVVTMHIAEQPGGGFTVGRPVVHPTWSQPVTMVTLDALKHQADPALGKAGLKRLARSLARSRALLGTYFPA